MSISNFSWNGQAVWMCEAILYIPVAYSLIMVTITRHVFINIFQTEHFSAAVKYAMGYEKNMRFLVIVKSPKVWKKVEKIGQGFFNVDENKPSKNVVNFPFLTYFAHQYKLMILWLFPSKSKHFLGNSTSCSNKQMTLITIMTSFINLAWIVSVSELMWQKQWQFCLLYSWAYVFRCLRHIFHWNHLFGLMPRSKAKIHSKNWPPQ